MIVTLLTDFGTEDYFVGAMKGVILSRNPEIRIVDITHHVPRHDVGAAAFLLGAAFREFPPGTVHLVVVDPGVGSDRRPLAVRMAGLFFVGPDNGVFAQALAGDAHEARMIENDALRRPYASTTFHGRDIFAPTAAALADGFPFTEVGSRVELTRPESAAVILSGEGFEARILHVDHFGNCVTNIRPENLPGGPAAYHLTGDGWTVEDLRSHYAGAPPGRPFLIVGSAGYLEISVDQGSAAVTLGLARGDRVRAIHKR